MLPLGSLWPLAQRLVKLLGLLRGFALLVIAAVHPDLLDSLKLFQEQLAFIVAQNWILPRLSRFELEIAQELVNFPSVVK